MGVFHFFALRVDSPLGVRGKEWEKRKNEIHLTLFIQKKINLLYCNY